MKILVIDDSREHLAAAHQTLVGHEVFVCETHDEAIRLLEQQFDKNKFDELYEKCEKTGISSRDVYMRASKESLLPYWDVVLCDLLMSAGKNMQGAEGRRFVGQEMPIGWSLALTAAQNGAKFVAVVTDMNHHNHPASAMLDLIDGHVFSIDSSKMILTNRVKKVGIIGTGCICERCSGTGKETYGDGKECECGICEGSGTDFAEKGKDWGEVLSRFTDNKE